MRKSIARLRGLGFILWHSRHHAVHLSFGLLWAWIFRELWGERTALWITLSIIGSELPDMDHVLYIFFYGKKDKYAKQIKTFLKNHEWRSVAQFLSVEHKHNTNLMYHNYYFMLFLLVLCLGSSLIDWQSGIVLFGAMFIHYVIDIVDDIIVLGHVNANWKRWGRPKKSAMNAFLGER